MNKLPVPVSPKRPVPPPRREDDRLAQIVSAFESETADVLLRTSPKNERTILYVLLLMLVSVVTLSAFVKLDRVVTGNGQMVSVGGPLYVSLNSGVVKEVLVKVGDNVKKGQVLATLDPTLVNADVAQLKQKLESLDVQFERLQTEQKDGAFIPSKPNPYNEVQLANWRQRRSEYQSNLANFDAQILNARAVIARYQQDAEQYSTRMKLAADVQTMYEPLVRKGYVSQLQLSSAKDTKEEMSRLYSQSQNQIAAERQNEAALRAQRSAFVEKWHAAVSADLISTRNELDAAREELQKALKFLEQSTLVAPADAIVLKIGKISTGSIAGSVVDTSVNSLFTLVPMDAPLEAEIRVSTQDIGFIRPGDSVSVKLDAYSFVRHGTAEGKVKTISEGSFTTDENNAVVAPYIKARIAVTEVKLRDVPADFRLTPGMTLSADVMVGRRTILSYLISGALRTGAEAMREAQ